MNGPTKEAEDIARRLLASEADESDPAQTHAASRVIEKLRLYLTKFIGRAGFQTLLARAVALAKTEAPWLASVQVNAEGLLVGFEEAAQARDVEDAREGQRVLLTQLLALLLTFLGPKVTLHMAQEVCPDAGLDDLNFSTKETR